MTQEALQSRRLDALEARVMHQDQTIEDLNAALTAQWRHINRLSSLLEQLDGRLSEIIPGGVNPPDRPPPHY